MTRVKQFADDLGISKNKAQALINKGRSRKDGGSQILENVMADKTKDKKKKKKEKKFRTAEYRIEMDGDGEFIPELAPRKRFNPKKDSDDFMPDMKGGRAMAGGGSNVTRIKKDKTNKAKVGQLKNIGTFFREGKMTAAEVEKALREIRDAKKKGGTIKMKDGGSSSFPDLTGDGKVTKKDILKGRGVPGFSRGGGMAIQGLGFTGVK